MNREYLGSIFFSGYAMGVRKNNAGCMVPQIMPISRKNTFREHKNKLSPRAKIANKKMHGKISSSFRLYTRPNKFIIIKNTTRVSNRLNNSPIVSDKGK